MLGSCSVTRDGTAHPRYLRSPRSRRGRGRDVGKAKKTLVEQLHIVDVAAPGLRRAIADERAIKRVGVVRDGKVVGYISRLEMQKQIAARAGVELTLIEDVRAKQMLCPHCGAMRPVRARRGPAAPSCPRQSCKAAKRAAVARAQRAKRQEKTGLRETETRRAWSRSYRQTEKYKAARRERKRRARERKKQARGSPSNG